MKIYFIGTYQPIMCGLADYTAYITQAMRVARSAEWKKKIRISSTIEQNPARRWGVISFNPKSYGSPLIAKSCNSGAGNVWRGLKNRDNFSSTSILKGLAYLAGDEDKFSSSLFANARVGKNKKSVLWFQHEFGIWKDSQKFITMLKELKIKKIVTLHTIHFQSRETRTGLTKTEYELLKNILPEVDAITVFSQGVYGVVVKAWPGYQKKIHLLEHGVQFCPKIAKISKKEARSKLFKFLIEKSSLDETKKQELKKQNLFFDPDVLIIGSLGFVSPKKSTELIFKIQDCLQKFIPGKRIIAMHIGTLRAIEKKEYINYYQELKKKHNGLNKFLLEIWLPPEMLAIAQKSFNIVFYWPEDCTQSGILTYALGVGTPIAGRDLEGVGEVLKKSGQIVEKDWPKLILQIKRALLNPSFAEKMSEQALSYTQKYRYENQAQRHFQLAESLFSKKR